jgi:outer membrane protein assembly factor BamB
MLQRFCSLRSFCSVRIRFRPWLALLVFFVEPLKHSAGSDWPQLLGPGRDGVAVEETLHAKWDSDGPKVLWKAPVGNGFSGIAVSGDRAIAFVREGDEEIVRCFDVATGDVHWESPTPCAYQGGVSEDKGPRCVPLISEGKVFTFGVQGRLRCLSLADGSEHWQRDTTKDFRPLEGYFGVGSTPVLFKDRLIVNVGGRENASIVAFNINTGATEWSTFQDAASYSSPIVTSIRNSDLAIVVTRMHAVGLDPSTGEKKFAIPFGARGPTVNGATPVVLEDQIFFSASYNIGSLLIDASKTSAEEVWRNEEILATQYATPVPMAKDSSIVFAMDGRQDAGRASASLKCIDIGQQKVLWEESGFDYGSLIRVNTELLVLTCGGELIRVAASPKGYHEISRATVLNRMDSGYRLPALSNGRLFIRDDSTLKCLEVGLSKSYEK